MSDGKNGVTLNSMGLLGDMEQFLCDADRYATALDCLIEQVGDPGDREMSEGLEQTMGRVSADLQQAVQQARRLYYKIASTKMPNVVASGEELSPRRAAGVTAPTDRAATARRSAP